jgi:nucleolar protein 9
MCDLFRRKRGEWVNKVKALGAEVAPVEVVPEMEAEGKEGKKNGRKDKHKGGKNGKGDKGGDGKGKSAIELARERFGAKRAGKSGGFKGKRGGQGTGANQVQKIGA